MRSSPRQIRGEIVVWGLLGAYPFGGMTWQVLHHLAGLRSLGFDVWYVEDSERPVYAPTTYSRTLDVSWNVEFVARHMSRIGLGDRWAFRLPGTGGMYAGTLDTAGVGALYRRAEAVFDVCGAQEIRGDHEDIRCLVLLETDPVVNQVEVALGDAGRIAELERYHHLFTYGSNLGGSDCRVPVERFHWRTTYPPVVVDWWTSAGRPRRDALTTVARWKNTGKDVVWRGERWQWSKHVQFERFLDLPRDSVLPLEVAISGIDAAGLARLEALGWTTRPLGWLTDPDEYRVYIRESLGEFSVAKDQYVTPRTGWLSDRTVCYLASGRPAVVQDTGVSAAIPTGEGLLTFSTRDEALDAISQLRSDYGRHARAALELARTHFEASSVLGEVAREAGLL